MTNRSSKIALSGIPNKVQVGDMGMDGRIFPVGTKPSDSRGMFADHWFPIQVKQTDKVGRPDAQQECAPFHKRTGRIIKLLTVQEILDEEHVQKM